MPVKFYTLLFALAVLASSCFKQSIADAMLQKTEGPTATIQYEINGKRLSLSVKGSENQPPLYKLSCQKAGGYVLSGMVGEIDFVYTFYTDSLKAGNYEYTINYGPSYVTTFEGRPQYVYGPTDHMRFTVTSYKEGRISGTFSGQLTPAVRVGTVGNVYGTPGSVVIKNGTFSNVPVIY